MTYKGRHTNLRAVCVALLVCAYLCLLASCIKYAWLWEDAEIRVSELEGELFSCQLDLIKSEEKNQVLGENLVEMSNAYHALLDNGADYEEAWQSIGECRITHYCSCAKCCGKSDGITASGALVEEGRTVAVDSCIIPLGSEVLINGQVYIAEDTGAKGNHVDIYVNSHEKAIQMGTYKTEVSWRETHD